MDSIVSHVRKLLPYAYALWTMECFFKLSGKNRILFLWCNDLRVFNTVRRGPGGAKSGPESGGRHARGGVVFAKCPSRAPRTLSRLPQPAVHRQSLEAEGGGGVAFR